jgi:hypothetical protein
MDSGTVSGLRHKLHGWLKEVNVQPNQVVHPPQTFKSNFRGIPFISHKATYHIAILLLNVTAIVLLVGTRPRECDLLITAIIVKAPVNELTAIV